MARTARLSPGRRQYLDLKRQYPDALLLFRMGDFYETFDEDARVMARVLEIALTRRDVGGGVRAPLAGIPHHSLETHLGRLIGAGLKVAVCEQTSDPAASKGVLDRAVVRIVTPGTVLEPALLDEGRNNYLAAVVTGGQVAGLAYVDVTTSEFVAGEMPLNSLPEELHRIGPSEVLADREAQNALGEEDRPPWTLRDLGTNVPGRNAAADSLKRHFGVATLAPFGIEDRPLAVQAAAAVLDYLRGNQFGEAPQVTGLAPLEHRRFLGVDRRAAQDLELFEAASGRNDAPTLLSVLDRTKTAMGRRLLRNWLARPLTQPAEIDERLDGVARFYDDPSARRAIRDALSPVPDMERLVNRTRAFTASPRDLAGLAAGLAQIPRMLQVLSRNGGGGQARATGGLRECPEPLALIERAIADAPPVSVGDGAAIRIGFDAELDEVRGLAGDARVRIAAVEDGARAATGIRSLKVGYNRVFGYYIEVSKSNLSRVPPEFERRQTLVNAERFITPELKELEARILNARERISELERALFRRVCSEVARHGERIMASAAAIARIDAQASLAEVATANAYVRPKIDEGEGIDIQAGRHAIVEAALGPGRFVPNDTLLSTQGDQLAILTGPNMSGKSTYIRQVALIVLMAQIGSYVPAERARIGVVDRIFTRCNLSDDITGGRSTFLVEMEETAAILHQATRRSLVVLDEIGRGTSTYDGLAIARAVAEFIHSNPKLGCRTLFATHYHEMTALPESLPRAVNYQVAVSEEGGEVVFLHRILPGGADRSYGVHVGRLAGLPSSVIARAWEILSELESAGAGAAGRGAGRAAQQLPLLTDGFGARQELLGLDISAMTPLQAITKLYELQEQAKGEGA